MPRLSVPGFISAGKRELAYADAARDRRDWLAAAEWYRKHLERRPKRFTIWVQLGHALKESGQLVEALAAYEEAMRLNAGDADLLLSLGHLHKLMGRRRDAIDFYQRSADADGNRNALEELRRHEVAQGAAFNPAVTERNALAALETLIPQVQPRRIAGDTSIALPVQPGPETEGRYQVVAATSSYVRWQVSRNLLGRQFFAEIDGQHVDLQPKKISGGVAANVREDVLVEAIIRPPARIFHLRVGFRAAGNDAYAYMPFASTGTNDCVVNDCLPTAMTVSADDLLDIARSIRADSIAYSEFVGKFGSALANAGVEVDVLFVDGTGGSVSVRYRILNVADGLQRRGRSTLYVDPEAIEIETLLRLRARVVVFFRAPLRGLYRDLAEQFRARGSKIVYDIDDLVFDESLIPTIDGVRLLADSDRIAYVDGVRLYHAFAAAADMITTPTSFLSDYAATMFGVPTAVVRNTIGERYIESYGRLRPRRPTRNAAGRWSIGYYSGSRTHQVDFAQACGAITAFMEKYADVELRIVGSLDLEEFPRVSALYDRVVRVPTMPYHEMIHDLDACNVIIAPLVVGEPFCEAKSELKFFEAALRGVPCIASATQTFQIATNGGVYARLAKSETDWFEALEALYLEPDQAELLAERAYAHATRAYAYGAAGAEAERAYFGVNLAAQRPAGAPIVRTNFDRLCIAVIVSAIVIGGGGHRKILRFCSDWSSKGHRISIYVDTPDPIEKVQADILSYGYGLCGEVQIFNGVIAAHDAVVCTQWTTAYALRNYTDRRKVFYFVQDFEPMFEPASSNYLKALATYRFGFNVACYGGWVGDRLRREFGIETCDIPLTIDAQVYRRDYTASKTIDVLLFGRPSQPRRCFELAVEAIDLCAAASPELKIGIYGEGHYTGVGFSHVNFGLISHPEELANLYNRSHVGLCISSTNPSLVGYEMLACGTALVDVRTPGYEANFGGDGVVYYADATPEAIAAQIARALNDGNERARRVLAGQSLVAMMRDDTAVAEQLMGLIVKVLSEFI